MLIILSVFILIVDIANLIKQCFLGNIDAVLGWVTACGGWFLVLLLSIANPKRDDEWK